MWICPECGESIEAQFDSCWKCAGNAPELRWHTPTESQKKRRRVLGWRQVLLEVVPMFGALALTAFLQHMWSLWFSAAATAIFTNVALCIRDGAVLEYGGTVCEREKHGRQFWWWIAVHCFFGGFCLAAAIVHLMLAHPPGR